MDETTTVQGREITKDDIELVRRLIEANPSRNRTRLSKELCLLRNWRAANGQVKDMACRTLLLKLGQRGYITLPLRQSPSGWGHRRLSIPYVPHKTHPIACALSNLAPVHVELVEDASLLGLFNCLISQYHYLGFNGTVGENMRYLVFDREHNPLASHILGKVTRRISSDWIRKYSHPIYLLETFVEQDCFRDVCYQAANWIYVGQTKGRSRNGHADLKVPVKDIYLYPLTARFREVLSQRVGEQKGRQVEDDK